MLGALMSVVASAVLAVMVLAIGGCGSVTSTPELPPTEAEARAHLDKVVQIVAPA